MINSEAVTALELASSYIDEVESVIDQIDGDYHKGYDLLRTLDRAKEQVERAKQLDDKAEFKQDNATIFLAKILGYKGMIQNIALGKRSKALEVLKKSLEISENLDPNQYAIGAIYAEMGKKEKALFHLKKAIELAPKNMDYRKLYDRVEKTSSAKMRLGAFRGSWKVFLGFSSFGVLLLFLGLWPPALILLGIAFIYWMLKSR